MEFLQKYRINGLKQTFVTGISRNCCTIAGIISFGGYSFAKSCIFAVLDGVVLEMRNYLSNRVKPRS